MLINLTGESSASISGWPSVGDVTFGGDRAFKINGCGIGDLTVNNTAACQLNATSHGDFSGDGTLSVSGVIGTLAFDNSDSETVSFDVSQPDSQYFVSIECPMNAAPAVGDKTADGFTVTFDGVQTGSVGWSIIRS